MPKGKPIRRRFGPRMRDPHATAEHLDGIITQMVLDPKIKGRAIEIVTNSLLGKRKKQLNIIVCLKMAPYLKSPRIIEAILHAYWKQGQNSGIRGSILHTLREMGFYKTREGKQFLQKAMARAVSGHFVHSIAEKLLAEAQRHH